MKKINLGVFKKIAHIHLISLGSACFVKHQIDEYYKSKNIQTEATNFFDWVISSDLGAIFKLLMENNFDNIFSKENIITDPNFVTIDNVHRCMLVKTLPHVSFAHDIPLSYNEQNIIEFIEKYRRRYIRLISLIRGGKKIFFLRNLEITDDNYQRFKEIINKLNPKCNFVLVNLIIDDVCKKKTVQESQSFARVYINNYKKNDSLDDWQQSKFNWTDIFKDIGL